MAPKGKTFWKFVLKNLRLDTDSHVVAKIGECPLLGSWQSSTLYTGQKNRFLALSWWRPSAILNFKNFHSLFGHVTRWVPNVVLCINFIKIGWFFVEIWRLNDFQDGARPPSWVCEIFVVWNIAVLCKISLSYGQNNFSVWQPLSWILGVRWWVLWKKPRRTSNWSSIKTITLDCLVFEKIAFVYVFWRQTLRHTQTDRWIAPLRKDILAVALIIRTGDASWLFGTND